MDLKVDIGQTGGNRQQINHNVTRQHIQVNILIFVQRSLKILQSLRKGTKEQR